MILGDIAVQEEVPQTARVEYTIGPDAKVLEWAGEQGVAPFTRMSIFDSPAVNFHVDDDLEYVYVPTVLSLFSHVNTAIKGVHDRINGAIRELAVGSTTLLSRFPRESTIYPFVETLGASTDLAALNAQADRGSDVDQRIDALRRAVAALEADALSTQIAERAAKDDSSYSGATFSILRLEARAESTLLVWTATHPRTLAAGSDFDITKVDNFPVLQTKTDRFAVLTHQTPTGQRQCVCSDVRVMRAESNPQGALYPPLPKGTASVVLTSPWFADVTVRVSQP
jgi:hypothetical protein